MFFKLFNEAAKRRETPREQQCLRAVCGSSGIPLPLLLPLCPPARVQLLKIPFKLPTNPHSYEEQVKSREWKWKWKSGESRVECLRYEIVAKKPSCDSTCPPFPSPSHSVPSPLATVFGFLAAIKIEIGKLCCLFGAAREKCLKFCIARSSAEE